MKRFKIKNMNGLMIARCSLIEHLVRNNALTNALTFSYVLSNALSKLNLRLTRCLT
jgi:hypothetical protein